MGRELRRKEAKRNGKNVREVQKLSKEKPMTMKTFITILVTLLVFFVILYIITGIFITKDIKWFDKKEESTSTNESTISNRILASDTLRQSEEEYYVYYYDSTDENSDVSSVVSSLSTKVYRVDLNDAFNSNYIGEPSGIVSDISELKVSDPTIIKVISSTISEYYNGVDEITNNLK